ncbi:methyltransferase-like protein 27 [Dendronephthya gigantea]|uniref:methyltransferase-like protein 27 n=1 Tax=Dendronephthya gigantea TaxID=151771 RepID=UPI00106DCBB1|nr:methyltransferase-like protein 27 [Dendronephthya gigantea]
MSEEGYDGYSHVKQLNADTTEEELIQLYSKWYKTYDKDVHDLAYIGPVVAANQLMKHLKDFGYNNDVTILDLGCGTGLVGEQLHKNGYKNIDGLDCCQEILKEAKAKSIYKSLQEGYMASDECKDLGVGADLYDAAICVGVFTLGHVKGKGFDDLVHVVKPGGLACFNVNEKVANNPEYKYDEKMSQLVKEGKWKLLSKYYEPQYYEEGQAWFYVYQIL